MFETEARGKAGPDGMPASLEVRGFTPTGDAAETFTVAAGKTSWKRAVDAGSAAYSMPAYSHQLDLHARDVGRGDSRAERLEFHPHCVQFAERLDQRGMAIGLNDPAEIRT